MMRRPNGFAAPDWYTKPFNQDYMRIYAYKDRTAEDETDGILRYLGFPKSADRSPRPSPRILDLACGWGRHSVELARRGYRVTGLDLSSAMIEEAARRAKDANLSIDWISMDMIDMTFNSEFDAVINIFTSFGYYVNESQNVEVVNKVFAALVPGGKFLLDLDNPEYFVRRAQHTDRFRVRNGPSTESVLKEEFLTWKRERRVTYSFLDRDNRKDDLVLRCYLYDFDDIKGLIESSTAFQLHDVAWGDFEGSEHPLPKLSDDLSRLIVLATKPRTK